MGKLSKEQRKLVRRRHRNSERCTDVGNTSLLRDYWRPPSFVPPQPWTHRHTRQHRASYWENRQRDRRRCPESGEPGYPKDEEDWTFRSLALGPCKRPRSLGRYRETSEESGRGREN